MPIKALKYLVECIKTHKRSILHGLTGRELDEVTNALHQANLALSEQGEAAQPAADGPVPTYECPFVIGQRVKLAAPYAEEDPNRVFFITEIRWEYRQVAHRGWNITIAPSNDIERGYGATDGFSPSDLSPASPGIASQAEEGSGNDER